MTDSPSPTKRRLPFKPTALAKPQAPAAGSPSSSDEDGDGALNLFNRSKETLAKITAQRERRIQKKREQKLQQQKTAQQSKIDIDNARPEKHAHDDESPSPLEPEVTSSQKRRKVSYGLFSAEEETETSHTPVTPSSSSHRPRHAASPLKTDADGTPSKTKPGVASIGGHEGLDEDAYILSPKRGDRGASWLRRQGEHGEIEEDEEKEEEAHGHISPARSHHSPAKYSTVSAEQGTIICLDDDDDDDNDDVVSTTTVRTVREPTPSPPLLVEEEVDPEIQIYIDRARAAHLQRAAAAAAASRPRHSASPSHNSSMEIASHASGSPPPEASGDTSTPEHPDRPAALVEVASTIPGIVISLTHKSHLAFKQFLDEPVRILRATWLEYQKNAGVPIPDAQDVFLTWRGNRLYQTTTLSSLGIRTHKSKMYHQSDPHNKEGFSSNRTRVVFEAWTEPLFRDHLEKEDRARLRALGELSDSEPPSPTLSPTQDTQSRHATTPPRPQSETRIRVVLRAKDGEPVKMSATASTPISVLAEAFRRQRDVPDDIRVVLYFDGELLEEDMTVGEADVGDLESIEVHLK